MKTDRTVYIDGVQYDVNEKSETSYIFNSPIFRDLDKIISNRTSTYKLPKTKKNLKNIGLSNSADVTFDFPYKKHTIKEYRSGLLFLDGSCILLSVSEEIELSVTWGMSTNLLTIKDKKLRDMVSDDSILWSSDSSFMTSSNLKDYGFLYINFGRGMSDFNYIHPSVNFAYILDLIKKNYNISIKYTDQFKELFKKLWIPLIEKNANQLTWNDTYSILRSNGFFRDYSIILYNMVENPYGIKYEDYEIRSYAGEKIRLKITDGKVELNGDMTDVDVITCVIDRKRQRFYYYRSSTFYNSNGKTTASINIDQELDYIDGGIAFHITIYLVKKGSEDLSPGNNNSNFISYVDESKGSIDFDLYIYQLFEQVPFGKQFPLVPNLPDMKVTDFLKTIMQMFGLWVNYDRDDREILSFISIDEIYNSKNTAYNWTNKMITTNKGKSTIAYTYGDYAMNNYLKYKNDSDITINADATIPIDNANLANYEKTICELDFSPSNSVEIKTNSDTTETMAKIELYNDSGELQSVGNRILMQTNYTYDPNHNNNTFIIATFNENLYFSSLLEKYYSTFIKVINHPFVMDCYTYLKGAELTQYSEVKPIYIDGVYYMPITVTVQTNGVATCKLIKMPTQ